VQEVLDNFYLKISKHKCVGLSDDDVKDIKAKIAKLDDARELLKKHEATILHDQKTTFFKTGPQMYNKLLAEKVVKISDIYRKAIYWDSDEVFHSKNYKVWLFLEGF
jgi:uncharacterized membrane protein